MWPFKKKDLLEELAANLERQKAIKETINMLEDFPKSYLDQLIYLKEQQARIEYKIRKQNG